MKYTSLNQVQIEDQIKYIVFIKVVIKFDLNHRLYIDSCFITNRKTLISNFY